MSILGLVPVCDNPMSSYTYLAFCALFSGIGIGSTALIWWCRREINRVEQRVDEHDEFTDDVSVTIAKMSTDIAVTREAVQNLEHGMKDLKKSISEINRMMMDNRS